MLSELFPDVKTAVFFILWLGVLLAALFGYADWYPSTELADLAIAIVALVSALLPLFGVRAYRARRK